MGTTFNAPGTGACTGPGLSLSGAETGRASCTGAAAASSACNEAPSGSARFGASGISTPSGIISSDSLDPVEETEPRRSFEALRPLLT
jgi:hypothetical protein